MSRLIVLKFYKVCFCSSWGLSNYVETTKLQTSYFSLIYYNKKSSRTSVPAPFSAWLLRKIFVIAYQLTNCIFWLSLLRKILDNVGITIVCWPGFSVINFAINLYLYNLVVFSTWPKSQDKTLNILKTKCAFKMK